MRTATNNNAATWSYLAMLLMSGVTYLAGESAAGSLVISMAVLGVAMLKGHLLGAHFMGLAKVRGVWRWVVLIWLVIPASVIGAAFVLAARQGN